MAPHLLVVDDHAAFRELAALRLRAFGCTCVTVESVAEAIDALARERFDALLSDHSLRGQVRPRRFVQTRRMSKLTRRQSLVRLVGVAAAAAGVEGVRDTPSASAAIERGVAQCILTPELTQGPFYVPGEAVRHDITEGKPGTPLLLSCRVVNASTCKPIAKAAVDVWHCDAGGVYSGAIANNAGTNFLRGIQRTNAKGIATFKTIYPGFYAGRAVHIHVKVYVRGNVVHTGQLFLPPAITEAVYAKAPYSAHGRSPDTPNAHDAIFRNGGRYGMLALTKTASGYTGTITMGVHV